MTILIKNASVKLVPSHFHVTGISLLQPLDYENQGEFMQCTNFVDAAYELKKFAPLPAKFKQPGKLFCQSNDLFAPICTYNYEDVTEYPMVLTTKAAEC